MKEQSPTHSYTPPARCRSGGAGDAAGEIKSLGSWRPSPASFSEGRGGIFEDESLGNGVVGAAERRGPPSPALRAAAAVSRASASRPRPGHASKVCHGAKENLC